MFFDATTVEPAQSFEPLPDGEYLVMATSSEVKDTKAGTGKLLQLTYQVIDGPYKNRLVFDRINFLNASPSAQEIGQRQLSALCHAVGKLKLADSSELHNIPFIAKIKLRQEAGFDDSNEVKAYRSATEQRSIPATTTTRPAATQARPSAAEARRAAPPPRRAPSVETSAGHYVGPDIDDAPAPEAAESSAAQAMGRKPAAAPPWARK